MKSFESNRNLIVAHTRRLQKLKEQQARQGINTPPEVLNEIEDIEQELAELRVQNSDNGNILPPQPELFIGREEVIKDIKTRLGIYPDNKTLPKTSSLTVIVGWPGLGKTTTALMLAHDPEVRMAFPDGILWADLGEQPDIASELGNWGITLGTEDIRYARNLEDAVKILRRQLRNRTMLLIVDDVWKSEHGIPFREGRGESSILITTRSNGVANFLAYKPSDVYRLPLLQPKHSLQLLKEFSPTVVEKYPQECLDLVNALEGLPLAISVAGRLLKEEAEYGWGVSDLLDELHKGTVLIEAIAPADRTDLVKETTPTIASLLQSSVNHLDDHVYEYFVLLGVFRAKPATFDLGSMADVWEVDDPKPIVKILVDRGLLEPIGDGRFQMHALLARLAEWMLSQSDKEDYTENA